MKRTNFYLIVFVMFGGLFVSCGDDDMIIDPVTDPTDPMDTIIVEQAYDNGVLIVNEGAFSGGSGTLDYYDRSEDVLLRNVYASENDDQAIGSVLQSVTIIDDNAYLIVNNSAKIEVVDATTMKYKNTINGVFSPRYMADLGNGMAVVSEWGLDGVSGQIKLVDLSSMMVTDSVTVSGPEQILVANDKVYVANSGGFGESNLVSVHGLDLQPQMTIPVGKRAIDMVLDVNGDIWVLSGGSFIDNDGASLCQIKNDAVENCVGLSGFPSDLIIDASGEKVYYLENGIVNKINVNVPVTSELLNFAFLTGNIYGLGFDGIENALYIGTTPDFSSESTTYVVNESGDEIRALTTGVLTNGFIAR